MKKLVLIGTTGSGKTTFLKNLVGENFNGNEVARNVELEEMQKYNTFTAIDKSMYENSTTTISMNAQSVLFYTTRTNEFSHYLMRSSKGTLPRDDIDCLYPALICDSAGQERLSFMQEIALNGADAVFIFSDGTNVQSIERISHYINLIRQEEEKNGKKILITVFLNKKDLESRGMYIGVDSVKRWIEDASVIITETSNLEPDTFNIPIRNILNKIDGFPIPVEQAMVA